VAFLSVRGIAYVLWLHASLTVKPSEEANSEPRGNRMVTWPITSHDPEKLMSWPQYVWGPLARQRLQNADTDLVTMTTNDDPQRTVMIRICLVLKYLENSWRCYLAAIA